MEIFFQPETPDNDDDNWNINSKLTIERGYDKFLNTNNNIIKDSNEALDLIHENFLGEFGLYNKFEQFRNDKIHSWSEIYEDIDKLRDSTKYKLINKLFFKLFKRGKIIEILTHKIIDFESDSIFNNNQRNREFKSIYSLEENIFKEIIKKIYLMIMNIRLIKQKNF